MLVLRSSTPFSSRVPVQLGTTVLDRAMSNNHCRVLYICQQYVATDLYEYCGHDQSDQNS